MSEKMFKAGQSVSAAYKKFDDLLDKGLLSAMKENFTKKKTSTSKALTVFDPKKALPATTSKLNKLKKFGKIAKFARATTPIGLASLALTSSKKFEKGKSPQEMQKKAFIKGGQDQKKAMQTASDLSKMLNFNIGGNTMLKNPKKADLDKDGKLSSYEKKRGKAIEENMKAKKGKMMYANVGMAAKKIREKDMMKASMGKSVRGYGAARTSGTGMQDQELVPGKSMDYYKDLM